MLVPVVLLAMMLSPVFKFWLYLFRIIVLSRLVAVLYLLCVCVCACACAGRCGALVIAQKAKRPTAGLGVCLLSGRMCLLLICVRSCPLCLSQERESVGGVSFFFLEAFCVKRLRVLLDG